MTKNELSDYRRDTVKYSFDRTHFSHNYKSDYQIVLIEEKHAKELQDLIAKTYTLSAVYDITWSYKHLEKNKKRLGINNQLILQNISESAITLKAVVFEIKSPQYVLTPAGSHQVDWSATPIAPFLPHLLLISHNIEGFFYNSALILGLAQIQDLFISNNKPHFQKLDKDLEGAEGWNSFTDMFAIANVCSDWLVLRNAEFLPDNFWGNDKDIDVLCRSVNHFVLAVNANDKGQNGANFVVNIESKIIDVDIRFIGDDYYDRLWEDDMLLDKNYKGIVPLLSPDNYFYSLLYHARIHKITVKPIYIPRLVKLAESLGFNLNKKIFTSNQLCAQFMDSYFIQKGYKFTSPSDYPCFESLNRNVIQHISQKKVKKIPWTFNVKLTINHLFLFACRLFPRPLKELTKRVLGR